jgi:hypothetical protein
MLTSFCDWNVGVTRGIATGVAGYFFRCFHALGLRCEAFLLVNGQSCRKIEPVLGFVNKLASIDTHC